MKPAAHTTDAQKITERRMREIGYSDGYARRPCKFSLLTYQASYRQGTIARDEADRGDDAA